MQAIVITEPGDVSVLKLKEVPKPEPNPHQVLIEVYAAGVNRLDLLQRQGNYPAPPGDPQDIPGIEYAGIVAQVGDKVSKAKVGDRVCGLVGGGAYASYLVSHEDMLIPVPPHLSLVEAAAIPEPYLTAYDAIFLHGKLKEKQTILINAVASGVGMAAVQIAKLKNCQTIGTSRTRDKLLRCQNMGLDHGLLTNSESLKFAQAVLDLTEGTGVNLILELAGASYLEDDLQCLAYKGHLILVGLLAGSTSQINLATVLRKRLTIIGTVLRHRPLAEKIELNQRFNNEIMPYFATGNLAPMIDEVFSLEEAGDAQRYMAKNSNLGRIILAIKNE